MRVGEGQKNFAAMEKILVLSNALAFVARRRVYLGSSGAEALRGFPLYAVYVVRRRVVTVLLPCLLLS